MIYLYEYHLSGLYLSLRDDLDLNYCPQCNNELMERLKEFV